MATPTLINLQLGQVISLQPFTLPDIDKFLQALPEEDTELVFAASEDYDITNGYSIVTPNDLSFGLFGRVLFGSTISENTANFNSIKEYANSFPNEYIKDTNEYFFNVIANTAINSIYFDLVDAETRTISYTKITGNYTPLYFKVVDTQWKYAKNHNYSVIPIGNGNKNNVPNAATTTWVPSLSDDSIVAEVFNGLQGTNLEIKTSTTQIDTQVNILSNDKWEQKLVRINISNDLTNPIPSKTFNLTIRDIEDKTVYATVKFDYENEDLAKVVHKAIESFVTNDLYGSGTTSVADNETLQFGMPRGNITNSTSIAEWVGYINDSKDADQNPSYIIQDSGGQHGSTNNFMTFNLGNKSETGSLFGKSIMKYKPRVSINNKDSQGFIMSQPVFMPSGHGSDPIIKAGKNVINKVTKIELDTRSTNTPNTNANDKVILKYNETHTIILDKEYTDFKMVTGTYDKQLPQGVNILSAVWDNQQNDLLEIYPFIDDRNRFCCRVIPKAAVERAAFIYVQLHNAPNWDNGQYVSDVYRIDLRPGDDNSTPLDVVEEVTIMVGDIYTVEPHTLSNATTSIKTNNSRVVRVDSGKKTLTGIREGNCEITVSSKSPGYDTGNKIIRLTVLDYPAIPAITVNRKIIVIDVGSSTQVKLSADRVDNISFRHDPTDYISIQSYFEYDGQGHTTGVFNIKGKEVGTEVLSIVGSLKNVEQVIEEIEIHVIERDTYQIITYPTKIKADLKKDRNGKAFWATTNAGFLRWELRQGEELFSVTANPGTEYTDINILINPIMKGNTTLTLYGHNEDMSKRLVEISVPVKITKNVEIAKNEIWVSGEHKFSGVNDEEIDFLDRRYFTILKWLDRPTKDDVYGHTIFLPQRSGTLLTYEQLENSKGVQKRYFDLAGNGAPSRDTNPKSTGIIYLDTLTGEIWKCLDNTTNSNHWFSSTGKQIGKPEQLIYPKPGEKGFGVGPMSYDLHEEYGLTPLDGCFDPWSDEYGNYKDKYNNVYVNIPKHYIKATGSKPTGYIDTNAIDVEVMDNDDI